MKNVALGGLVGATLVMLAIGWQGPVQPALADGPSGGNYSSGDLIAFPTTLPDGRQLVTVIHPEVHSMAVYAIGVGGDTVGQIELRSVRNLHYDLQMMEHNISASAPRPREVMSGLQAISQRR